MEPERCNAVIFRRSCDDKHNDDKYSAAELDLCTKDLQRALRRSAHFAQIAKSRFPNLPGIPLEIDEFELSAWLQAHAEQPLNPFDRVRTLEARYKHLRLTALINDYKNRKLSEHCNESESDRGLVGETKPVVQNAPPHTPAVAPFLFSHQGINNFSPSATSAGQEPQANEPRPNTKPMLQLKSNRGQPESTIDSFATLTKHFDNQRDGRLANAQKRAKVLADSHPHIRNMPAVLSKNDRARALACLSKGRSATESFFADLRREKDATMKQIRADFPLFGPLPSDMPLSFYVEARQSLNNMRRKDDRL